jgi:hypothetical protein
LYQITPKYTNAPLNVENGHKIYEHYPFQGHPEMGFLVGKYAIWQPWQGARWLDLTVAGSNPLEGEFFEAQFCRNRRRSRPNQGCQICLATSYQNGENIPNYHKINKGTKYKV